MPAVKMGCMLWANMSDPLDPGRRTRAIIFDGLNRYELAVSITYDKDAPHAMMRDTFAAVIAEAYRLGKESKE